MYSIQNNLLQVSLSPVGGEILSILDNQYREWIWQGDPNSWNRHAPICFPFVGRLEDGKYSHKGKIFQVPTHGFARDMEFECTVHSHSSITFQLNSNEESKLLYPFDFSLEITYTLKEKLLEKTHRIRNLGQEQMFFALGGHDGFAIPEGEFESWTLRIPRASTLYSHTQDENGLLAPMPKAVPFSQEQIPLSPAKNGLESYIFSSLPRKEAFLLDGMGKPRIHMKFRDFANLVLWCQGEGFYCVEPWSTLPDGQGNATALSEKKGIRALSPSAEACLSYTTEFFI